MTFQVVDPFGVVLCRDAVLCYVERQSGLGGTAQDFVQATIAAFPSLTAAIELSNLAAVASELKHPDC